MTIDGRTGLIDEATTHDATVRRWSLLDVVLAVAPATAAVVAVIGFRSVFVDWTFLVAAIVGALGATAVAQLSRWRRLLLGETLALSAIGFIIVGLVLVGPAPTPAAFGVLIDGLRNGWADLLSTTPPVELTDELAVLPYALAWGAAAAGAEMVRRLSAPGAPIAAPIIAFGVAVLVTIEDRRVALAQGAILAVHALAIGSAQWARSTATATPSPPRTASARTPTLLVGATVVLALVALAAPWLGPRLPLADANERFDLRDRTEPPWDPLSVPSPLVQSKAFLRVDRVDDVVFTVRSDAQPVRFTTAVLGDFDGAVWTVGSITGASAVQEFRAVGARLPALDTDRPPARNDPVDVELIIGDLSAPFLPIPGAPSEVRLVDNTTPADAELRMNLRTGTIAAPAGTEQGDRLLVRTTLTEPPTDEALIGARLGPPQPVGDTDIVPLPVRNLAAELVEGVPVGWEQVTAIRDRFVDDGFYDVSDSARPGHSYFRVQEFLDDPDRIVGFEEQYAAAAALLARIADVPARVAVGFLVPPERYVDGSAEVLSSDFSAWIEVDVADVGWVPVDVTPDRSREPSVDASGRTVEEVAVPAPPPPPPVPQAPEILPAADSDDDETEPDDEDDENDDGTELTGLTLGTRIAIGAGAAIAALAIAATAIVVFKLRRRRRRRRAAEPARQVVGAWDEVLDRAAEAGFHTSARATPYEVLRSMPPDVVRLDHRGDLEALAHEVQRAAYHPAPPDAGQAAAAWTYHDRLVGDVAASMPPFRRLVARCDPRTLRRGVT